MYVSLLCGLVDELLFWIEVIPPIHDWWPIDGIKHDEQNGEQHKEGDIQSKETHVKVCIISLKGKAEIIVLIVFSINQIN